MKPLTFENALLIIHEELGEVRDENVIPFMLGMCAAWLRVKAISPAVYLQLKDIIIESNNQ